MITVLYFANIRESFGVAQEQAPLPVPATVAGLIDALVERHGSPWQTMLRDAKVLIAVNQVVATSSSAITSGDEVAFFPPVTGG